ncbi:MAG: class II fumarate hydratase [Pseudomonadales bacterium]
MEKESNVKVLTDSLGTVEVPDDALYGAQTQRAIDNFPLSHRPMPAAFLQALAQIKAAAAGANATLGLLDPAVSRAISEAALEVANGAHLEQFPVDVYQTGSGTSTNMNMNEVLATLAGRITGSAVHPNDQVNLGQSSNDVIPAAIHLSAARRLREELLPAVNHLIAVIDRRAIELSARVKTGRTHLMDAMPLTYGQELSGWSAALSAAAGRIDNLVPALLQLPLGATAVGTGVNAHVEFARTASARLRELTGLPCTPCRNNFAALSSPDTAVALSGELKALAVTLMKISNDLRWMNSGPLAGLAEIELPALQPGSSIMPGKVNPVIPEAVAMVCAQIIGYDTAITVAGQSGNFQLNVMLPLIASNLLEGMALLGNASRLLADRAIAGFQVREDRIAEALGRNPILVTALNPIIGYAEAAAIARRAYAQGRDVIDVAEEMTELSRERLEELLDPERLTKPAS